MDAITYPTAYMAFKAGPCNVNSCRRRDGCDGCEFSWLREHAARDNDMIRGLKERVEKMSDALKRVESVSLAGVRNGVDVSSLVKSIASDALRDDGEKEKA